MTNDLFADVPTEGGNIDLIEQEEETTPDSQPETVEDPKEDAPSQEGDEVEEADAPKAEDTPEELNIPFHKHPRWKAKQEEIAQLKQRLEEVEKAKTGEPIVETTKEVPEHLKSVFGNDYEAYAAMQEHMSKETANMLATQQREAERAAEAEQARNQEFIDWAETELSDIGQAIGVNLSDPKNTVRNQILDICEKYGVTDDQGRPNFQKAHELHQQLYPSDGSRETTDEKKKIAAKTAGKASAPSGETSNVITSSKLRKTNLGQFF